MSDNNRVIAEAYLRVAEKRIADALEVLEYDAQGKTKEHAKEARRAIGLALRRLHD